MLKNVKPYFDALSGIRVLCALTVVLHHTLLYFNPSSQLLTFQLGDGAVTLFFVLSGFVMYYCYGQQKTFDLKEYYKYRFIRIFPLYWVSLLLFFIFVGSAHFWMVNPSILQTLLAFFGIQSFIPYPRYYFAINPVGWFVSAEIFLCVVFPFLVFSLKRLNRSKGFLTEFAGGGG